jgi:WhiB family transcriptional regulator, redox-sensing transcriptional regulator
VRVQWQELAACAGENLSLFFPKENIGGPKSGRGVAGENERIARAKEICAGCTVVQECLEYAILHDCVGIWGGLDTRERNEHAGRGARFSRAVPVVSGS